MNELISIVINVYNGEKYLKKCLDSIVNQTYKNLEILIINDGSTDNTLKEIKKYKDERIRVITTKNQGLSLSRNIGLDNFKGEYIYFIDIDDYIEKDTIEYLYKLIKKYEVQMATCESLEIYDKEVNKKELKEKIELLDREETIKKNLLSENHFIPIWNKLMHKDLFKEIRFDKGLINDLAFTYKVLLLTDKIVYSNQIKYYYYRNVDSITIKNKNDFTRNREIYKVSLKRYKDIKIIYPSFIANDIGLLRNIVILYNKDNKELHDYLDKEKARKNYKKIYKFRMLFYKMSRKEKYMMFVFRLSPKLCKFLYKKHSKLKNRQAKG